MHANIKPSSPSRNVVWNTVYNRLVSLKKYLPNNAWFLNFANPDHWLKNVYSETAFLILYMLFQNWKDFIYNP